MKTILCSASYKETGLIIKHFNAYPLTGYDNKIFHYTDGQNEIYFAILGMGHKNVIKHLSRFIEYLRPDKGFVWILTGYTGCLHNNCRAGEIFIPSIVRNENKEYELYPEKYFKSEKKTIIVEVNTIYGETEKLTLNKTYPDADIIDMESAAFCEIMGKNNIKGYFIFKAVTDNLNYRFPDASLIRDAATGRIKFKMLLSLLYKEPGQLINFIILYINIKKASKNIYKFFIRFNKKYENQSN